MASIQAPVTARLEAMPGVWQIHVHAPGLVSSASPGRFVMALRGPSLDPYLRISLPIHRIGRETMAFLLDETNSAHRELVSRGIGETMDLLGPWGRGYALPAGAARILLIGQDLGVASLVALAEQAAAEGRQVTLLTLTRDANRLYPAGLLSPEIEYHALVGSEPPGSSTGDLLADLLPWAEQICAAGSQDLYRLLAAQLATDPILARPGRCQVYLDVKMACGFGVCGACSTRTRRGVLHPCTKGPVVSLDTLEV